jgi:hypothetical protein
MATEAYVNLHRQRWLDSIGNQQLSLDEIVRIRDRKMKAQDEITARLVQSRREQEARNLFRKPAQREMRARKEALQHTEAAEGECERLTRLDRDNRISIDATIMTGRSVNDAPDKDRGVISPALSVDSQDWTTGRRSEWSRTLPQDSSRARPGTSHNATHGMSDQSRSNVADTGNGGHTTIDGRTPSKAKSAISTKTVGRWDRLKAATSRGSGSR